MKDTVIDILKGHFGRDKEITPDDLDVVDVLMQIEEKLNITVPEEETFDLQTVQQLLEVVEKHNVQS